MEKDSEAAEQGIDCEVEWCQRRGDLAFSRREFYHQHLRDYHGYDVPMYSVRATVLRLKTALPGGIELRVKKPARRSTLPAQRRSNHTRRNTASKRPIYDVRGLLNTVLETSEWLSSEYDAEGDEGQQVLSLLLERQQQALRQVIDEVELGPFSDEVFQTEVLLRNLGRLEDQLEDLQMENTEVTQERDSLLTRSSKDRDKLQARVDELEGRMRRLKNIAQRAREEKGPASSKAGNDDDLKPVRDRQDLTRLLISVANEGGSGRGARTKNGLPANGNDGSGEDDGSEDGSEDGEYDSRTMGGSRILESDEAYRLSPPPSYSSASSESGVDSSDHRPFKCLISDCTYHIKGFETQHELMQHLLSHYRGELTCALCQQQDGEQGERPTFVSIGDFKEHLVSRHGASRDAKSDGGADQVDGEQVQQKVVVTDEKKRACCICDELFNGAQDMYDHIDDCLISKLLYDYETATGLDHEKWKRRRKKAFSYTFGRKNPLIQAKDKLAEAAKGGSGSGGGAPSPLLSAQISSKTFGRAEFAISRPGHGLDVKKNFSRSLKHQRSRSDLSLDQRRRWENQKGRWKDENEHRKRARDRRKERSRDGDDNDVPARPINPDDKSRSGEGEAQTKQPEWISTLKAGGLDTTKFPCLSEDYEFEFYENSVLTASDAIKCHLELFTGASWDWWPLEPPRRSVTESGRIGITLRCPRCGHVEHDSVSREAADQLRLHPQQPPTRPTALGQQQPGGSGSQAPAQAPPSSNLSPNAQSTSGNGRQVLGRTDVVAPPAASSPGSLLQQPATMGMRYVLLGLNTTWMHYDTLEIDHSMQDREFMAQLRASYRRMAGFWRFYCHPEHYGWCEFTKFRRISVGSLTRVRREVPPATAAEYEFRPRPPRDDPPISRHEWAVRYRRPACNGNSRVGAGAGAGTRAGTAEAVAKVPKRAARFQLDVHAAEEDMWGLEVRTRPACSRVLAWMLVLLVGPVAFWARWYGAHPGDWQDASVLVSVVVALQSLFWIPLSAHFRH